MTVHDLADKVGQAPVARALGVERHKVHRLVRTGALDAHLLGRIDRSLGPAVALATLRRVTAGDDWTPDPLGPDLLEALTGKEASRHADA